MKNFFRKPIYLGIVLVIAGLIGCSNLLDPPQESTTPRTAAVTQPISIGSEKELALIGNDPNYPLSGNYILTASFPLSIWTPIGDAKAPFTGVFDGNNQTLTLQVFNPTTLSSGSYLGIFSYVQGTSESKAEIKDLTIVSSVNAKTEMATGQAVGLLAGYTENADITGITLSGSFNFTSTANIYVGGIVGYAQTGTVIEDSATGVTMVIDGGAGGSLVPGMSYNFVGGLVGLFKGNEGIGVDILHSSNTGNISAVCTTQAAQVFCGGIAGGSYYQFTTDYQGRIENCSSTGNILAQCPGFWSWAGGIAGCIVGDGGGKDPDTVTRIVNCWATGTVSVADSPAGFPYVGGIVAYNYYGALVSQCYFDGTVISNTDGNYTGGIAGYNSQTTGHNSTIENCWSGGTVTGLHNAGGIVGQNQVNTYVRNCYSTAEVVTLGDCSVNKATTNPGLGGIAGFNASEQTDAITGCVALNSRIAADDGSDIHRIVGLNAAKSLTALSNNFARSGIVIDPGLGTYTPVYGPDQVDGETIGPQPAFVAQTDYEKLGWDFNTVWKWNAVSQLPELQWQ